jgi:hypothetical protein
MPKVDVARRVFNGRRVVSAVRGIVMSCLVPAGGVARIRKTYTVGLIERQASVIAEAFVM